jgi:hypothetical protein
MVTSGLPNMCLGFERAMPDIMSRPPQSLSTGIFTSSLHFYYKAGREELQNLIGDLLFKKLAYLPYQET